MKLFIKPKILLCLISILSVLVLILGLSLFYILSTNNEKSFKNDVYTESSGFLRYVDDKIEYILETNVESYDKIDSIDVLLGNDIANDIKELDCKFAKSTRKDDTVEVIATFLYDENLYKKIIRNPSSIKFMLNLKKSKIEVVLNHIYVEGIPKK